MSSLSVSAAVSLICLLAGAEGAAAQALPDKLSRETRDSMQLVINEAAAAGLPTDALYAKAAEGVLKRADDARILAAVRNLASALAEARAELPATSTQATVIAAASALQAGADRGVIARYASAAKGRDADLTVAYITLADLIASNVAVTAASRSVEALLVAGVGESGMTAFRAAVANDIRGGARPQDAIATRTRQFRP